MIEKLDIYCITNKRLLVIEDTSYKLAGVGLDDLPEQYLKCNTSDNIFYKEKHYSE